MRDKKRLKIIIDSPMAKISKTGIFLKKKGLGSTYTP